MGASPESPLIRRTTSAADAVGGATPLADPTGRRKRHGAGDILNAARAPKVGIMLALGFSSGLPFLLIGNTLNYWLGDAHVDLAVIGFASWIGLSYSIKFLWGAVVDGISVPGLGRLGQRRGWMVFSQVVVAAGLFGMAASDPAQRLSLLVGFGLVAALGAATQDVVIDAWRIESSDDAAELDLMTSAYSLGYRVANILTGSVILFMAGGIGWPLSYAAFALLMGIGLCATVLAKEPAAREPVHGAQATPVKRAWPARVIDAVVGPFAAFFRTMGPMALLILAVVTTYHLCDYLRGPVINPFYVEVGLSKSVVASVRLIVGLPTAMLGIALGGLFATRYGHKAALIVGAALQPLAVASFAVLAATGPNLAVFSAVMGFDDLAMTFAGVALIAYISTLTTAGFTATQYALLTSAVAITGKTLKGFSGEWVKTIAANGTDLLHAYATYFGYAAVLAGVPALILVVLLAWLDRKPTYSAAALGSALTS